mgnify:CR=1 FL=1
MKENDVQVISCMLSNETEELLLLNIIHSVSDHQPQGSSVNVAEKVH